MEGCHVLWKVVIGHQGNLISKAQSHVARSIAHMSGPLRMKTRAEKRSLKEEMDLAVLNGFGEAAQVRWAMNSDKRMRESAAKTLHVAMFAELPQPPRH